MFRSWLVGVVMWTAAQHGMVMFHYPRWSPDGRWLVMTGWPRNCPRERIETGLPFLTP